MAENDGRIVEYRLELTYGGRGGMWGIGTHDLGPCSLEHAEDRAAVALRDATRVKLERREVAPWTVVTDSGVAPEACLDCDGTGHLTSGTRCPTCEGSGEVTPEQKEGDR